MPQHPFIIPSLILFVAALACKNKIAALLNIFSFILFLFFIMGFEINIPFGQSSAGTKVRVLTYNIHRSQGGSARIANTIASARPDIICLQEANPLRGVKDAKEEIDKLYPGWHRVDYYELTTISRYPIIGEKVIMIEPGTGRNVLVTTHQLPECRLTVINTHFSTSTDGRSIRNMRGSFRSYMRNTANVRAEQMKNILRIAKSIKGPMIIAGDFNTPPRGRIYRRIAESYQDSFSNKGLGFGYTFKSNLPLIRIDYIFTGGSAKPLYSKAIHSTASDHRPVIAELAVH